MTGCTSEPSQAGASRETSAQTDRNLLTGRAAFQKLYIAARGWARDAQPYRLESMITDDSKGKDGKSAVWRASFGSPLQRGVKPYTWSGEDAPDLPRHQSRHRRHLQSHQHLHPDFRRRLPQEWTRTRRWK